MAGASLPLGGGAAQYAGGDTPMGDDDGRRDESPTPTWETSSEPSEHPPGSDEMGTGQGDWLDRLTALVEQQPDRAYTPGGWGAVTTC
jgi:hypothetical protein